MRHLLPIVIVIILIFIGLNVLMGNSNLVETIISPSPSPTVVATPTILPSPTIIPTIKPTPTIIATPKPTAAPISAPPGVGYSTVTVATQKGNFSASVLTVDLGSSRVITDTANDNDCANDCPVTNLADFVTRNGGFGGVNGTYFCPAEYPECAAKKNSFDFPVYNTRLGKWINGGNIGWNSRSIMYFDGSGGHFLQNASSFGGGLTAGIVNYPGLVDHGNVQIDDNQSGLSDKQKVKGTKVGLALRGSNIVMAVIARNVTMQEFALVMKGLFADSALNLDSGGSIALYSGRYLAGPGRNIPNAVIFARK